MAPTVWLRSVASARATMFGTKLSYSTAANPRSAVRRRTRWGESESTRETVAGDTPARSATSLIEVIRLPLATAFLLATSTPCLVSRQGTFGSAGSMTSHKPRADRRSSCPSLPIATHGPAETRARPFPCLVATSRLAPGCVTPARRRACLRSGVWSYGNERPATAPRPPDFTNDS